MIMSKGVSPHAFSVVEVDYANVDRTRGAVKDVWKKAEGFSLTYLPFISRATIDALADFPHLNASVGENELVVHRFVDLGIAVDLDYEGLIVPVIRDAEDLRLRAIAQQINDLAGRARTQEADARRDQRRHVHDLQQRLGRLGADDADHQPAAGGDPLDRRDHPQAGRRRRRPTAARRSPSTRSATWPWRGTTGRSTAPTPPASSSGSRRSSRRGTGRPRSDASDIERLMLRVRWLGSVPYREALAVQQALFDHGRDDHLLLLEHPHVFTYGPRADLEHNLRCDPAAVGADFVGIRRGGDITYHGPGQLVGYPILTIDQRLRRRRPRPQRRAARHRRAGHVRRVGRSAHRVPRRLGRRRRARTRARSAPSACASSGAARCTASRSTWRPT